MVGSTCNIFHLAMVDHHAKFSGCSYNGQSVEILDMKKTGATPHQWYRVGLTV